MFELIGQVVICAALFPIVMWGMWKVCELASNFEHNIMGYCPISEDYIFYAKQNKAMREAMKENES